MRVVKFLVLLVAALAVLAFGAFFVVGQISPVRYVSNDALPLHIRNLEQIAQVLEGIPEGREPLLRVSLDDSALAAATSALSGVEVRFPGLRDTRVTLTSISTHSDPGELRVELDVSATSPEFPGEPTLKGTGLILFDKFETTADGKLTSAIYRVHIERLQPKIRLGWLWFRTRDWATEFLRGRAIKEFGDSLTVKIPIPSLPAINLGFDREETTFVEDTGANYVIRSHLPSSELKWGVAFHIPIPSKDGIHVLADDVTEPRLQAGVTSAGPTDSLRVKRDALLKRVEALSSRLPTINSGIEISVHRSLLERVVSQVNELPADSRTVKFQLISRQGRLVNEIKEDKVLGKGGYYVEFNDNNSASGRFAVGQFNSVWDDRGLVLTTRADADASARMKILIDPYIGGGFDFDMGIDGKADVPLEMGLVMRAITAGERSALLMGPVIKCKQFPMTVEGGGSVKFGVEMYELVGEKPPEPTVIATNSPHYVQMIEELKTDEMAHDASFLKITVSPENVRIAADSYQLSAGIAIERHRGKAPQQPVDGGGSGAESDALGKAWAEAAKTDCPTKSDTKFLFAGQDFGPNNDIVRAIAEIMKAVDRAKHNVKVAWNDVEEVVKNPARAPAKAVELIDRSVKELGRAAEKVDEHLIEPVDKHVTKPVKKFLKKVFRCC